MSVALAVVALVVLVVGLTGCGETADSPDASVPPGSPTYLTPPTSKPRPSVSSSPGAVGSPVFVGEPCDPAADTEAGTAVNGLTLYCLPGLAGSTGRWAAESPPPQSSARPELGGACDPADVGKIVPGAGGQLVACLADPAGGMRWSDVP